MMAANYQHIGGHENRLGRHYSRFSAFWSPADLTDQSLALRKSQNAGSNGRSRAKADKEAHGEFESECPGYCGAQDTFYVGTLKGVGRIYQQTFIDTYAKVAGRSAANKG